MGWHARRRRLADSCLPGLRSIESAGDSQADGWNLTQKSRKTGPMGKRHLFMAEMPRPCCCCCCRPACCRLACEPPSPAFRFGCDLAVPNGRSPIEPRCRCVFQFTCLSSPDVTPTDVACMIYRGHARCHVKW